MMGIVLLYSSLGLTHGGDKPGPHGGFIEMPGAFHTEVVPGQDGSFDVYLIDIEFKNPTVKDSAVQAWLQSEDKKTALKCDIIEQTHFRCLPTDKEFKGRELIVKAKREKMQGNEARYKLPLHR
jgi:hypothetical protein